MYKLVLPIYEAKRSHQDVERVYRTLSECYKELVKKGTHRFLGSYFRVGFYGLLFGDLDTQEFIYKEAALTRLGEFSINLQVHGEEGGERRGEEGRGRLGGKEGRKGRGKMRGMKLSLNMAS